MVEDPNPLEEHLAAARRDPRLGHDRTAIVADWYGAMEAADRTRIVAVIAITNLAASTPVRLTENSSAAERAAWFHGEYARAEEANEYVELNAMTFVAMLSALDALVEAAVPAAHGIRAALFAAHVDAAVTEERPDLYSRLPDAMREAVLDAQVALTLNELPRRRLTPRIAGKGVARWEEALGLAGLHAPTDRLIPGDLGEALQEAVVLRHVLVHRAGRIGADDLRTAPGLDYQVGELIRLRRRAFQRYTAAIHAYGVEVVHRLVPFGDPPPPLENWRLAHTTFDI